MPTFNQGRIENKSSLTTIQNRCQHQCARKTSLHAEALHTTDYTVISRQTTQSHQRSSFDKIPALGDGHVFRQEPP
jgi:hypothetical protein